VREGAGDGEEAVGWDSGWQTKSLPAGQREDAGLFLFPLPAGRTGVLAQQPRAGVAATGADQWRCAGQAAQRGRGAQVLCPEQDQQFLAAAVTLILITLSSNL
jgi:hypothetical protein